MLPILIDEAESVSILGGLTGVMRTREVARTVAILSEVWREAPRYAERHAMYRFKSRRDPTWLDSPLVVQTSAAAGDFSIEVLAGDEIGRFLYLYGLWDLLGTRLVQGFLRSGMTVLDVGANIGYYSLLSARMVGSAGLVQSFEPHDEIRERLTRNVARNGLQNIVVRPEAVTDRTGTVDFFRSADASNQGISTTVEGPALSAYRLEERPVAVPAIRLDELADGLEGPIDLIKIDVEGAEPAAFAGGERLLSADDAPLVLFEAYELGPTAAVLSGYGFMIRRLSHDRRHGLRLADDAAEEIAGEPNYVAYKRLHEPSLSALARFR